MKLTDSYGGLRYGVRGEGPPLVLLTTLSGTWMRQVPTLSRSFTVVAYDFRGFGASAGGSLPSNAEHADDLASLLDHLAMERAVVVGMSHGGLVAQHFAVRYPERLAGLGLVATFAVPHGPTRLLLQTLNGFLQRDDIANFWEVLKTFLFSAAGAERVMRHEKTLRRAMFDQYDVAALSSIYQQALEHDSTGWFGPTSFPTLVVGGAEDILFPPVLSEQLAGLFTDARLELLPAAHIPPVEAPAAFNRILVETFGGTR